MMTETNIDYRSISEKVVRLTCAVGLAVVLSACGKSSSDGEEIGSIPLPTDTSLKLFCEDAGVADEVCILDDPENPYALTPINNDNKFALANAAPGPKARFYLWGTVQAMSPSGENQFFTAISLKEMWEISGSEIARDQSLRGFRAILDNYIDGLTFLECGGGDPSCPLTGTVAVPIQAFVWPSLQSFFNNDTETVREYVFENWGFLYDINTEQWIRGNYE